MPASVAKPKNKARRVKQETIDAALYPPTASNPILSIQADPSSSLSHAKPDKPVKQEQDPVAWKEHWKKAMPLLARIWTATPAIPSLQSRIEWARTHHVPASKVHNWFSGRGSARRKKGLGAHSEDGYELAADAPLESPCEASSSVVPSSPLRTPSPAVDRVDSVQIVESDDWANVQPILIDLVPSPTVDQPLASCDGSKSKNEVESKSSESAVASIDRKRARSVKVEKTVKADNKPAPRKRRRIDKATVEQENEASLKKNEAGDTMPEIPVFDPKRMSSRTVPPHSPAAKTYTLILVAPLLYEAITEAPGSNEECVGILTPAKPPTPEDTPAFEALDDPVAFLSDCKKVLKATLDINYEIGLWDSVVEALPPSFLMNMAKDLDDFDWPDDWP